VTGKLVAVATIGSELYDKAPEMTGEIRVRLVEE
jgi:hypothetical protein